MGFELQFTMSGFIHLSFVQILANVFDVSPESMELELHISALHDVLQGDSDDQTARYLLSLSPFAAPPLYLGSLGLSTLTQSAALSCVHSKE